MRVPSGWGLESPGIFTHPSRAGSNLEAGLPGTVVQAPAVAWALARGSQSTCIQESRCFRLVLYDGCSLRSHLASLCLFFVDQSVHKPPRIQGEGTQTPTSQWKECQRACSRVSKLPQQEVTVKLLSTVYQALTLCQALCRGVPVDEPAQASL